MHIFSMFVHNILLSWRLTLEIFVFLTGVVELHVVLMKIDCYFRAYKIGIYL